MCENSVKSSTLLYSGPLIADMIYNVKSILTNKISLYVKDYCAVFDIDKTVLDKERVVIQEMKELVVFLKNELKWKIAFVTARRVSNKPTFYDIKKMNENSQMCHTIKEMKKNGFIDFVDYLYIQDIDEKCPGIAKTQARENIKKDHVIAFMAGDMLWDIFDIEVCGQIRKCTQKFGLSKEKYYVFENNGVVLLKMPRIKPL
jgi:hypothetical protein